MVIHTHTHTHRDAGLNSKMIYDDILLQKGRRGGRGGKVSMNEEKKESKGDQKESSRVRSRKG